MDDFYVKRAFEIFRNKGTLELLKRSMRSIRRSIFDDEKYFSLLTIWNKHANSLRYDCPTYPYQPVHISPDRGELASLQVDRYKGLGQIRNGDWDLKENAKSYSKHTYEGLRQRYIHNYKWEETIYYKKAKEEIREKGQSMGYSSVDDFLNIRCEHVDELYNDIKNNGYRPNFEGTHNVPEEDARSGKVKYRHKLEPLICVGREGDIFWTEGIHRLTICRILDIDTIPVQVLARHKQWQKIRDEAYNNTLPEKYEKLRDHPDLRDTLRESPK